jgi:nucleotide-binding universal stress UspA family protein
VWDFRIIVAAVDFSQHSHEVLRVAGCLAGARLTDLHVVHVVADAGAEQEQIETAASKLQRIIDQRAPEVPTLVRRVLVGSPPDEIARYALHHRAHLIVMGTHGYGAVRRLLLGSVAQGVLRQAHCPVLTVPPRQNEYDGASNTALVRSSA